DCPRQNPAYRPTLSYAFTCGIYEVRGEREPRTPGRRGAGKRSIESAGGLLDDFQLRAARTALLRRGRPRRRLRTQVLLGEHHALAGLARVDAEHRSHRKPHVVDHAGEARVELHLLVAEAQ